MGENLDLHVSIESSLARSVDRLARARGLKRAELVRMALEQMLAQAAREERDAEMRRYVTRMARNSGELVRESDRAVRRLLLEETEW